jgi:SAM-dependent methyltransferase
MFLRAILLLLLEGGVVGRSILVDVISLEPQQPQWVDVNELPEDWAGIHESLMRLFPESLQDRYFRINHFSTGSEVSSVRELKEADDGAKFLVDDSQPAEWLREHACSPSSVKNQYHALPYPHRSLDEESTQFDGKGNWNLELTFSTACSPIEINHYIYDGQRDMARKPFRMLIAGGGTGDATISAALGFAALESDQEFLIYHLDMSVASIEVARKRLLTIGASHLGKEFPGLTTRVRFVHGSLLELPAMLKEGLFGSDPSGPDGLRFDFINCMGVLHHLPSPVAGLRALAAVLKPDGGMGIGLYGLQGRTGVYDIQKIVKLIERTKVATQSDTMLRDRQDVIDAVVENLPRTNWFRRNEGMLESASMDESERMDIVGHQCDQAYTVPAIAALLVSAGEWAPSVASVQSVLAPYSARLALTCSDLL